MHRVISRLVLWDLVFQHGGAFGPDVLPKHCKHHPIILMLRVRNLHFSAVLWFIAVSFSHGFHDIQIMYHLQCMPYAHQLLSHV